MDWQWTSRKGNDRKTNSDAAAVANDNQFFFAIIVDAAEKGGKGAQLAHFWVNEAAKKLIPLGMPTCEQIVAVMRENHKFLRESYLCDIASYSALLLHHQSRNAWGIHCGDCRLGILRAGKIIWQSNPHTRANMRGEEFQAQDCSSSNRHKLTRSLNAKRFAIPDIQKIDWLEGDSWLLGSDGYWADYLGQKIPWDKLDDDASCMEIFETRFKSQRKNDSNNCFDYSDKIG